MTDPRSSPRHNRTPRPAPTYRRPRGIGDAQPVTAERMVRLTTLGQQGSELFPDGLLFDVWWQRGHGVYAPLHREALDTPRMIEHLVPVYTLTASLLAEPLSLPWRSPDSLVWHASRC